MNHLKEKNKFLPIHINIEIVIGVLSIITLICVLIYILNKSNEEPIPVSQKNIYSHEISDIDVENIDYDIEDDVIDEEILEDEIEVTTIIEDINGLDESDIEELEKASEEAKVEKVVKYKDKEVVIPQSTVAAVNSVEDAEKNKKEGGKVVSQEQANEMFQNEGQHSNGIDVSAHQGKINWSTVKESGVDFAIIRVGFRGQTAGQIYEDKYFKTNVNGATANGIKVGVYFYSTAINETEALEEAAWVVNKIAPYRITYPVVYDFEDFGAYRCESVNGSQATKNAQIYLNYVKSVGYEPMMYANKSDITSKMSRGAFSCKFWLAHYTTQTDYNGSVNMWQYTSKGSVPGITGPVDMNVAYFSYGTTAAPKHTHNYSELVKGSEKKATCENEGLKTMRCSCGDIEIQKFPKLEHSWGEWFVDIAPTVSNDGIRKRVCSLCNKEETEKINKLVENEQINNTISNVINNSNNNTSSNVANNSNNNTSSNVANNSNNNTSSNVVNNSNNNTSSDVANNSNNNTSSDVANNSDKNTSSDVTNNSNNNTSSNVVNNSNNNTSSDVANNSDKNTSSDVTNNSNNNTSSNVANNSDNNINNNVNIY